MEGTLAALFSATLMLAGPVDARVDAPSTKPMEMSSQVNCWSWYSECYYCGEPGYWTCDLSCTLCEGWTEPVCEPTGWICNPRDRDRFSSLFAPAAASRPLSCKS